MSVVALVKLVKEKNLKASIEESLDLVNFKFNRQLTRVALKPNLCFYRDYSTGETTDPRVIGSIIDIIKERTSRDIKISIVESDASAMKCKYAFKILGYEKIAKIKEVKLVNLTNDPVHSEVEIELEGERKQFSIPKTIADADLFINVPKLKYMPRVKVSCALKNVYGCNPQPQKHRYHKWLDETIVFLNRIMPPDLCILDGIVVRGMETQRLNMIMTSTDPVAMDTAASEIAGISPKAIKQIKLASKAGVGSMRYSLKGESLTHFKNTFPKKTRMHQTRVVLSTLYTRLFAGRT